MNAQQSKSLVLTILGADKPGLVERLSRVIAAQGGNWVESRMAHLAGQFAGILRIDLPVGHVQEFELACGELSALGLQVQIAQSEAPSESQARRVLRLELVGHDRPGIVRDIAQALAKNRINVEELDTGVESAPMSAEMLFYARARLSVPVELGIERLQQILEPIGNDLMVDITLVPVP